MSTLSSLKTSLQLKIHKCLYTSITCSSTVLSLFRASWTRPQFLWLSQTRRLSPLLFCPVPGVLVISIYHLIVYPAVWLAGQTFFPSVRWTQFRRTSYFQPCHPCLSGRRKDAASSGGPTWCFFLRLQSERRSLWWFQTHPNQFLSLRRAAARSFERNLDTYHVAWRPLFWCKLTDRFLLGLWRKQSIDGYDPLVLLAALDSREKTLSQHFHIILVSKWKLVWFVCVSFRVVPSWCGLWNKSCWTVLQTENAFSCNMWIQTWTYFKFLLCSRSPRFWSVWIESSLLNVEQTVKTGSTLLKTLFNKSIRKHKFEMSN